MQTLQSINDADWSGLMAAGKDTKCAQAFFSLAEPVWLEYDPTDEIKWEVYCMLYDSEIIAATMSLRRNVCGKPQHDLRKAHDTTTILADIMEGLR